MAQPLFGPSLRGLLAAFAGDSVLKLLGFAATLITLHTMGPYQYGFWQLLLSVSVAFGVVTFPSISNMLVADISREIGAGNVRRANGIVVKSSFIFVSTAALGAVAMFIAAPFIHELSNIDVTSLLRVLSLSVFAIGLKQVSQMLLRVHLQFVHAQTMKAIDRFAYLLALAFFLLYMGMSFEGLVYAYVVSSFTSVILYAPYIGKMLLQSFRNHEKSEWKPLLDAAWVRGRWALGGDVVDTAIGSLWPWLIGFFLGVETVGIISVAVLLLAQAAAFVPVPYILRSVLPRTVETPERLREWITRSMKFSMWGNMLSGLLAFAACSIIFPLWFPHHLAALGLFSVLIITLPLRGISSTAAEWFFATGRQKELFLVSSLPKLAMYALMPLALYFGGVAGYVVWYVLNTDLLMFVRLRTIVRTQGSPIPLSFFLRPDATDAELFTRARRLIVGKLKQLFV